MSDIVDEIRSSGTSVSIELFPPKTEAAAARLVEEVGRIQEGMRVAFTSVTYGAGGSTREGTLNLVLDLAKRYPGRVVAHLTCVGADEESLSSLLAVYLKSGMGDIMALRGDIPEGMTREEAAAGGFRYAVDLVRWLRELGGVSSIGVAGYPEGHPETPDRARDLEHFLAKAEAGADYAATQFFFENADYFDFIEETARRGLGIPVAPGILPVRDIDQVVRFAAMCGASVPERVIAALEPYREDPKGFREKSADLSAEQIGELIEAGVRHIHIYSLNKSDIVLRVADRLGWRF
ncbi:MAG TPA: methylenetetrahydrofolate reductase [NAD(P)H] [Nitrospinae bacterium]|nr:methylenetetrahydrofolate reductase [NAD(P)H] [Nitrospinota bacterium]